MRSLRQIFRFNVAFGDVSQIASGSHIIWVDLLPSRVALPHQESDFAFYKNHPLWEHRCVFNHPSASLIPIRPKDRKPL